ncbi:MAG: hypothetical protein CMJ83_13215 [Planctomycetes bacterium]|nr:hypothetical protein [Planctomycetota bacterium]
MVQVAPEASPPRLIGEATGQMARLLGMATLAYLIAHRANRAILGLRASEKSPLLEQFNEVFTPWEPHAKNALLVAALLFTGLVAASTISRPRILLRILGATVAVAGLWCLVLRLSGDPTATPWPSVVPMVGGLVVAAIIVRPLVLAVAGALICTVWVLTVGAEPTAFEPLEQVGEVTLLFGGFLAWPLARSHLPKPAAGAIIASLALATITVWTCTLNWRAWVHVVAHLFSIHQAGIPNALMCGLLAAVLFTIGGLAFSGPRGRGLAFATFLLLASARGTSSELVALRVAAIAATVWVAMTWATQISPLSPVPSSSSSSSSSDSEVNCSSI